ncbi:pre-mRNA cleavage complex II protein Clp1 [Metarhizium album ARSEF 1941]|uniref:Kinase n=1 Tax=Metarhizium album (strain ARSEF 1941) TaxID=1081103 RepID=A0A0B2WQW2_METAS|nr:pre-mRNA cleavage complex II protein Clp1 [Metarhizium album ARSEF 1941]KHN98451.1 pre-mRNA cleavage complex II protein Clp1 [Metarhizium album ARSEF 1941]
MPAAKEKELPRVDQLQDYDYAVAGHDGTMCDPDGSIFVKPCTQAEINFYETTKSKYPAFASLMPVYLGCLSLNGAGADQVGIDQAGAGVIPDGALQTVDGGLLASIGERIVSATQDVQAQGAVMWVPSEGKKIQTDTSVVLENLTYGFHKPNVLDIKLGTRLYADDAPKQKQERFQKLSRETTHHKFGFRIAGMRVFRGSENHVELNCDEYKIYDKDYGRYTVNDDNVLDELKRFVFNKAAGIDENLGRAICEAFAKDLGDMVEVMSDHEFHTFSTSLLLVFEGDGKMLRKAIDANNEYVDGATDPPATKRIDSGICLDDEDEVPALPPVFRLKLIDFAHAAWKPGSGTDENTIKGVRSLQRLFSEMAQ